MGKNQCQGTGSGLRAFLPSDHTFLVNSQILRWVYITKGDSAHNFADNTMLVPPLFYRTRTIQSNPGMSNCLNSSVWMPSLVFWYFSSILWTTPRQCLSLDSWCYQHSRMGILLSCHVNATRVHGSLEVANFGYNPIGPGHFRRRNPGWECFCYLPFLVLLSISLYLVTTRA